MKRKTDVTSADVLFYELFRTGDAFTAHTQELEFRVEMFLSC